MATKYPTQHAKEIIERFTLRRDAEAKAGNWPWVIYYNEMLSKIKVFYGINKS